MPQIVGFKIQTIGKCTFLVLTSYFGANYRLLLFVRMSVNPLILFLDDDREIYEAGTVSGSGRETVD